MFSAPGPSEATESTQSELERYFAWKYPMMIEGNPLDWYKVCCIITYSCGSESESCHLYSRYLISKGEFPVISLMARDFLAIPASSTSVERLFSSAQHLCADSWSSMKAETITQSKLVKMWIKEGVKE